MGKQYLCLQCGSRLKLKDGEVISSEELCCPVCGGFNVVSHGTDSIFGNLLGGSGGG